MCFSKQPAAPINKPAYAPEDSYTEFQSSITEPDGTTKKLPKAAKGSVPTVNPSTNMEM
jgi:hypothetical protein